MQSPRAFASVHYALTGPCAAWELPEGTRSVSFLHDDVRTELRAILVEWARTARPEGLVAAEIPVRWDHEHPTYGVDPDVALFLPPPPDPLSLRSVCTWKEGHHPPLFAIEIVSKTNPKKDYSIAPDKYAACGARELVVFDPLLSGPKTHGGPFRLQVWRREEGGALARVYAGDGPAYAATLGAHLVVRGDGRRLRFADDAEGVRLWLTGEEAARARVADLEAELARRGSASSE